MSPARMVLEVLTILAPLTFAKAFLRRSSNRPLLPLDRRQAILADDEIDCVTIEDHCCESTAMHASRLLYGTFRDALARLEDAMDCRCTGPGGSRVRRSKKWLLTDGASSWPSATASRCRWRVHAYRASKRQAGSPTRRPRSAKLANKATCRLERTRLERQAYASHHSPSPTFRNFAARR